MAKKKNKPPRPQQTSLEQADQFLTSAFQKLEGYQSSEKKDLYARIHAVHDQLLLTMKRTGSGQRIYRLDFDTGNPRPTIADTYCHYMAPNEMDGDTLFTLYSLAALQLVDDLAAEDKLRDLQWTLDLLRTCFLDLLHQPQIFGELCARFTCSCQYLSKQDMVLLWLALVIDAPEPFFHRVVETLSLDFPDGHTYERDEDWEDFAKWAGLENDEEDESCGDGEENGGGIFDTAAIPPADQRYMKKTLVRLEQEDIGFHMRLLPARFRGSACDHLLEKIEALEQQNAKAYFSEDLRNPYARIPPEAEPTRQYQLLVEQMVANKTAPRIDGNVISPQIRPARVNLVLLRLCRTFVHLQLAQLFSEERLAHLRETALERMAEHYRKILNFLQDNHLYQEGDTLGGRTESPVVSAYWSRKDVSAQLSGHGEPLSNPHTELPFFHEVDVRAREAVTRRMRRGIEDFFGSLTQKDTLEISAGLWALGQKETLWLDTCLGYSLTVGIQIYSPFRRECPMLRDEAYADRGKKAFLKRIQPLADAIYRPNAPYASKDAAASLSFNDLLQCMGHHFIQYDQVLSEDTMVSSVWEQDRDILPQSDLMLGAALMCAILDFTEWHGYENNRTVHASYTQDALRSLVGSLTPEDKGADKS